VGDCHIWGPEIPFLPGRCLDETLLHIKFVRCRLQLSRDAFPIVVGISYLVVLTATISTSYEVSRFHRVMSNNGDVLCAASPPNKTLNAVRSRAHCIAQCNPPCSPSTCQNVNYWTNAKRCELFDYLPCSYDVRQDCTNYQVGTANKF